MLSTGRRRDHEIQINWKWLGALALHLFSNLSKLAPTSRGQGDSREITREPERRCFTDAGTRTIMIATLLTFQFSLAVPDLVIRMRAHADRRRMPRYRFSLGAR